MKPVSTRRKQNEKGYVLVMMAGVAVAVLAASGLAIDLGRMYIAKQETQVFADAAATAAALELDGTSAGITRANAAVSNSGNSWNFNTTTPSSVTVEYATSLNGTYATNPASAPGYTFARVKVSVNAGLYFLPLVVGRQAQTVQSMAVANQVQINTFPHGLSPYTAVTNNPTGPNFGMTIGNEYTIQWPQFNGSSAACKENQPEKCFVRNPCDDDSDEVMWSVTQNWGSNNNGYWGFSSNSEIRASILDGLQTQPINVGDNIFPILSNGNKAVQADYLDERAQQDAYNGSNDVSSYMANTSHNGRRLLVVPVVMPTSPTTTTVVGFAQMLLYSNGNSSNYYDHDANGPDPFCAIYAGPFNLGSNDKGGAITGSGAYHVTLVK